MKKLFSFIVFLLCFTLTGSLFTPVTFAETKIPVQSYQSNTAYPFETIPDYSGDPFIIMNDNQPYFSEEEKNQTTNKIALSDLDKLRRCGPALEVFDKNCLPSKDRGDIHKVYPSGWHQKKQGNRYVYNRCHLLGYAESGLNDESRNLITGTVQMNQDVMTLFEADILRYVRQSGNHVIYRVTPDFRGQNLVCNGLSLEAWSVEDQGQGLALNVYLYNVQDGVSIDYKTGYPTITDTSEDTLSGNISHSATRDLILNTSSKKFHLASCRMASRIAPRNRQEVQDSIDHLEAQGYKPAQCCIH